jgi:hypothetical protein
MLEPYPGMESLIPQSSSQTLDNTLKNGLKQTFGIFSAFFFKGTACFRILFCSGVGLKMTQRLLWIFISRQSSPSQQFTNTQKAQNEK